MTTLPELHSSRIRFAAIWLAIVASTMTVPVAKTMKNLLYTILAAGALASAALGLAGSANAAPSGPSVDAAEPAARRGLQGHRESGRHRVAGPVLAQRG
jgi:hypothetical protein